MSLVQTLCTSFKVDLFRGVFNFDTGTTQTFKLALYTAAANINAATTTYTTDNEVVGPGYSAGGLALSVSQVPTSSGTTAYINFGNVSWTGSNIVARGGLIYLANGTTNPSIAVLDFGGISHLPQLGCSLYSFRPRPRQQRLLGLSKCGPLSLQRRPRVGLRLMMHRLQIGSLFLREVVHGDSIYVDS